MKLTPLAVIALALVLASANANAAPLPPKEKLHLFLLVGQSNMAGRGALAAEDTTPHPRVLMLNKAGEWVPAVDPLHFDKPVAGVGLGKTFGQIIADATPGVTIGLIPCAVGGSPIDAWKPGVFYQPTKSHPWDDAIRRAKLALEAGELKGILWHQGESDSNNKLAPGYAAKLDDLIARLRKELNAPLAPFIVGQLGQFPERPWDEHRKRVNQAHRELPSRVPATAFVESTGLNHKGDEVHFDAPSYRELGRRYAAAYQSLTGAPASGLGSALTFHASFDSGLDADFSRGDRACFMRQGKTMVPAALNDEVKLASGAGRFGGALHFTKKGTTRPQFKDAGVLNYNATDWSATVSVWLRLDPDKDLEPGYCDPVQIVGNDTKKGFIFMEWSKDEVPRHFRYAIRPLNELWNPDNLDWAKMTDAQRPAVNLPRAPFSREAWTHAVFTLEHINNKSAKPSGRLYLNGEHKGTIEGWDLTLGWDPAQVWLVLGASYVGHMDDLAVFNRALTAAEVKQLHGLRNGVRDLHP